MRLIVILFALLFATPAYSTNDLMGPFSDIVEMSAKHGVVVEKLNEADTAANRRYHPAEAAAVRDLPSDAGFVSDPPISQG